MKKILIVDDSAFMRNVLKEMITSDAEMAGLTDFEIHEADGKKKALGITKKINPDVILLDVVMQESEFEGIEFLESIKEFFDLNKIIMITSIGQMEVLDKCKKLGVIIYIQKPFEDTEVINSIKKIVS